MDQRVFYWLLLVATLVSLNVSSPTEQSMESNELGKFESDWPIGDPRRCLEEMRLSNLKFKRFEALPGVGWDNLRNLEGGLVMVYNYTQCKLTDDGHLLIPDNVFTVPIKSSALQTFAELYDHWLNTTSTTSNTINIQAGLSLPKVSVSGSFSYENEQIKTKQMEDKAVTTRVQARYLRYEAKLQTDSILTPQFKNRLLSIAANIQLNRTDQARYEGQLLVRDFGTHVITSITAGAGLLKDDYLKKQVVLSSEEQKVSILATASASFFNIFHMSASFGHKTDTKTTDFYESLMTSSYIKSLGGPKFKVNMSMDDWINGVDDNLVVMDRAGDPLYFLVTPMMLPELPVTLLSDLEKIVRESIELYYEINTIRGCTALESTNFSPSANFDDGSCHSKPTNLTFGGTFQVCSVSGTYLYYNPCDGLNVVNPKTGAASCPPSYTAIKLQSGRIAGQTENKRECHSCHLIFHCCSTHQFYSEAIYTTYWCAATGKVPQYSGYLFGGLYTSIVQNPVTGTKGCPKTYYAQRMFADLNLCISDDFEMGEAFSVPFGGFFSCISGNPLAADGAHPVGSTNKRPALNSLKSFMESQSGPGSYPSSCPDGYSQHLAIDDLGCAIHYCVKTGALGLPFLPPIKRPPFMPKPAVITDPNADVMFNYKTLVWAKDEKVQELKIQLQESPIYGQGDRTATSEMSAGSVAAITICATLACVAIATVIIVVIRRKQIKRASLYRRISDETSEAPASYGSTRSESTAINVTA